MAEKKETKWKHLMEQTLTEHKKKKKNTFQASSSDLVSHKQVTRVLFLQTRFF